MKISTRQYVNRETKWQRIVDDLSDQLLAAEAKLREAYIAGETKLRESEIAALREAIRVFTANLKEYKESANEWRDQLADERGTYAKINETEKDISSVRQSNNETNKRIDDIAKQLLSEIKINNEHMSGEIRGLAKVIDTNSGRDKVVTILLSVASSAVIGVLIYFLNHKA